MTRYVLAVLFLLVAVPALAQQPSVIAPPGGGQGALIAWLISTLGPYVLPLALTLAGALAGGILHLLAVAISHLKQSTVRHYALAVTDAARQGVGYVEQVLRPTLPSDLSPEQAKMLRDAAVKAALEYLRTLGLDTVKGSLKLTDDQLLERLGVAVEATVAEQTTAKPEAPEKVVAAVTSDGRKVIGVAQPSPAL